MADATAPLPEEVRPLVRPNILTLVPYRCARDDYSDGILLDANENGFGSPIPREHLPSFVQVGSDDSKDAESEVLELERYPDPHQPSMKALLAGIRGVEPNQIAVGNGSDEIIDLLIRIFCAPGVDNILIAPPTYGMYKTTATVNDVPILQVPLTDDFQLQVDEILQAATPETKIIFVTTPGNPTGTPLREQDMLAILESSEYKGMLVVDEAYIDFALTENAKSGVSSMCKHVANHPRLVVMQTLSKAWGLAGIRLGMAFCHAGVAQIINNVKAPYNVNKMTSWVARQALARSAAFQTQLQRVVEERNFVYEGLKASEFVQDVYPSQSNFILFRLVPAVDALQLYRTMAERGVVIRYRGNQPGCENCLRATIGLREQNESMLSLLNAVAQEIAAA